MALPQAIDIRISMLRLVPQCFAFTSIYIYIYIYIYTDAPAVLLVHVGLAQVRPNNSYTIVKMVTTKMELAEKRRQRAGNRLALTWKY